MIPLLDLFNHRHNATDNIALTNSKRIIEWSLRHAPVRAGEELFAFYGPKDNAQLLLGYGFVEHVRAYRCLMIVLFLN
jgi:hypothetical protein